MLSASILSTLTTTTTSSSPLCTSPNPNRFLTRNPNPHSTHPTRTPHRSSIPSSSASGFISRRSGRIGSSTMAAKASASAVAQPLKDADELIGSVETFIFDCDGVIWKGGKLIDGVGENLDLLRSKEKRLVFITNNSTKSRKQYGKKFESLGLNVSEEEIFASSFAAAAYLKSINFPKDKKKVYVIGEEKELELAGFLHLGGLEDAVEKEPDEPPHHVNLALFLWEGRKGWREKAVEHFVLAAKLNPQNGEACRRCDKYYIFLNKFEEGVRDCDVKKLQLVGSGV